MANKKISIEEIKSRIFRLHGDVVTLVESTYKSTQLPATFNDKVYGNWTTKVSNVLMGSGHKKRDFGGPRKKLNEEQVKEKLNNVHGNSIQIIWETYIGVNHKALFIGEDSNVFEAIVDNVLRGHGSWYNRSNKIKATNMVRYGVENVTQNQEIALRAAKGGTNRFVRHHWRTGEELICQASWEYKVVDYLNANKIEYLWQPKSFKTSLKTLKGNMVTYRPDLFLVNENKWIEIKGWMRPEALVKWEWFQSQYPNSELWNKEKLESMGIL